MLHESLHEHWRRSPIWEDKFSKLKMHKTYNISSNDVIKWRLNCFDVILVPPVQFCNGNWAVRTWMPPRLSQRKRKMDTRLTKCLFIHCKRNIQYFQNYKTTWQYSNIQLWVARGICYLDKPESEVDCKIHDLLRSTFLMSRGSTSTWSVVTTSQPNKAIPKGEAQNLIDESNWDPNISVLQLDLSYQTQRDHNQLLVQSPFFLSAWIDKTFPFCYSFPVQKGKRKILSMNFSSNPSINNDSIKSSFEGTDPVHSILDLQIHTLSTCKGESRSPRHQYITRNLTKTIDASQTVVPWCFELGSCQ